MSPFAAGCAVCGTDLDPKRWDTGPSTLNRVGSWLSALSFGPSWSGPWVWLVILLILFGGPILASFLFWL